MMAPQFQMPPPQPQQVILEDDFQDQWFKVKLKDVLYQLEKWKSKRNQVKIRDTTTNRNL